MTESALKGFGQNGLMPMKLTGMKEKTSCDSILLEEIKDYWAPSVEILETEIKDIKEG